jgi:hypothetical protein
MIWVTFRNAGFNLALSVVVGQFYLQVLAVDVMFTIEMLLPAESAF